ncbi:MAG: hypothetical protein DRP84_02115 [Spirochaetes bacterium]|nr:MAG: hypothetical protein DRP84_02115 [Spirochaetota bacterium]
MKKTSLIQKIGLVLFGIVLFFILLEVGLRTGGYVITAVNEYKNKIALIKRGDYTVLCLGESTTDDEWPVYLAEELNSSDLGITFTVIDKGKNGVQTDFLLSKLDDYLDTYKPDMVITMMGINDESDTLKYESNPSNKTILFLKSFRIYKLSMLIWKHIIYKYKKVQNKEFNESLDLGENTYRYKDNISEKIESEDLLKVEDIQTTLVQEQKEDYLSGQKYIELGQEYQKRKEYKKAEAMYKKSLGVNPRGLFAYLDLGSLYVMTERYEQAEDIFKRGIKLAPGDNKCYRRLGQCYKVQGKFYKAYEMFKESIRLCPEDTYGYILLADCFMDIRQRRYDEAIAVLLKAKEIDPYDERIYLTLARCYYDNQQKYSEAEEILKKAELLLEDKVHNNRGKGIYIYLDLGLVYLRQEKYDQAEHVIKQAIKIDPYNAKGYERLGQCYKGKGRYDEAEKMFRRSIKLSPDEVLFYIHFAKYYIEQRNYQAAVEVLFEAKEIKPYDKSIKSLLEICYQLQSYKKLLENNPTDVKTMSQMIRLHEQACTYKEVERLVFKALEAYSDKYKAEYPIILNILGLYYLKQGKYYEAEQIYKKALEINSRDNVLYSGLATSYYRRDMYKEVEEIYKKAIKMYPEESRFHQALGLCFYYQKKYDLADGCFRKAKELNLSYYNPPTYYNYNSLKKGVQSRGIQLVCVQYPMLNLTPLKRLLEPYSNIIFVDNEKIFKDAVKKASYGEYFSDNFAGGFGHCTVEGNRLLAKNISDVILDEYFGK